MIMRFLFGLFLAAFVLSPIVTYAQLLTGVSQNKAGVTYTGPGDIVSSGWVDWHSCSIAYNAAYAAAQGNACAIRRASDSATCTFAFLRNGNADLTAGTPCNSNTQTVTAFCNATSCFVSNIVDQTGAGGRDAAQATAAKQLQIVFNALGTCPALLASGGQFAQASIPTTAEPLTLMMVAERTGAFSSNTSVLSTFTGSNHPTLGFYSGGNAVLAYDGSIVTKAATDSQFHAAQAIYNGALGVIAVDGSETTGVNPGSSGTSTAIAIGANADGGTSPHTGYFLLGGLNSAGLNSTQRTALNTNAHSMCGGW